MHPIDMAKQALRTFLAENSIRSRDIEFHAEFLAGYLEALRKIEHASPYDNLESDESSLEKRSDAFRRGYRRAFESLGSSI